MNIKNRTKTAIAIIIAGLALTFTGCNSTKEIPDNLTAPQLLQRGQSSLDSSDYKAAEKYFLKTIELYGNDTNTYIEAKYELAHTYLKQKKYDKAYAIYSELLGLYDIYGTALPGSYKKLCQIGISQIPEKKLEELQK